MGRLYELDRDGRAQELPAVECRDEHAELQGLLERNPQLLPGAQIQPDEPRRWLLVQRDVPVPCAESGVARWCVDLLLVDQDGIPTFVECKGFGDGRARREVVGQMLDYAANAHLHWERNELRERAAARAEAAGSDLGAAVRTLCASPRQSPETLFEAVEANLREGRVRLVFFLERAPAELKGIVEFLNRQMERSEVLIVEARQYECHGSRLVAPTLFGYTEEARRAKRAGRGSEARRPWDEARFFAEASERLDEPSRDAVRRFYQLGRERSLAIHWGTGNARGSFNLIDPSLCRRSFLSLRTDGSLLIRGDWYRETPESAKFMDELEGAFAWVLQVQAPEDGSWWEIAPETWVPAAERLLQEVARLIPPGLPVG